MFENRQNATWQKLPVLIRLF